MTAATCADCGGPMRQPVAILTMSGGCQRLPIGPPVCANPPCAEARKTQDRGDQAARDAAAIERAIAAGVIDP